ncbi:uncharacterized protein DUF2842 [Breoghania corrubedonensis]|uniref:Uncharacterized protein DUF2842 n=1 Tax=Breoghania corrubedonensis TaxID=665038 RepID=A0A2T5V8M8_9HYPH|nr:DUF2842 domain-containing protein [Breoghania corrubedonensis]PTW60116.1 uncharacterized protein DUF2842 [Breoghania corrubedonensis]
MPPLKRLFGTIVLVVFVVVYAFVAAVIGDMTMQNASELTRIAYYLVAGLLWTVPAGAIIWWMYRR